MYIYICIYTYIYYLKRSDSEQNQGNEAMLQCPIRVFRVLMFNWVDIVFWAQKYTFAYMF